MEFLINQLGIVIRALAWLYLFVALITSVLMAWRYHRTKLPTLKFLSGGFAVLAVAALVPRLYELFAPAVQDPRDLNGAILLNSGVLLTSEVLVFVGLLCLAFGALKLRQTSS